MKREDSSAMMTHKERFMTAVHLEEPDIVPIDASFIDPIHVEAITGKQTYGAGSGGGGGGVVAERRGEEDLNAMMMHRQKLENEAKRKLELDAFSVSDYNVFPEGYRPRFISQDTYVDHFARVYRIRPDSRTTWWIDGQIKSPEDLDSWEFPDPDEINYDIVDLTVEEAGDEYPVVIWIHGSMMFPYLMRGGIDKLVLDIYRKPDFAKKLIKTVADLNLEITRRMLNRGGDLVAESDDIADVKSPFFPPKIFKEFFFPHLKRLIDECHRRNLPYMKHSDGNLYPILDDLIDLGVNGLHPIEPGVMDLADVKKHYGKRIFLRGNVDITHVLPYGTEEDVRRDVRRCIDAAAESGGFILADSNSLHSNVKTENILTMIDEGRKYGRYPIRKT